MGEVGLLKATPLSILKRRKSKGGEVKQVKAE